MFYLLRVQLQAPPPQFRRCMSRCHAAFSAPPCSPPTFLPFAPSPPVQVQAKQQYFWLKLLVTTLRSYTLTLAVSHLSPPLSRSIFGLVTWSVTHPTGQREPKPTPTPCHRQDSSGGSACSDPWPSQTTHCAKLHLRTATVSFPRARPSDCGPSPRLAALPTDTCQPSPSASCQLPAALRPLHWLSPCQLPTLKDTEKRRDNERKRVGRFFRHQDSTRC